MVYLLLGVGLSELRINLFGESENSFHLGSMTLIFERTSRICPQTQEAGTVKAYPFGLRSNLVPTHGRQYLCIT